MKKIFFLVCLSLVLIASGFSKNLKKEVLFSNETNVELKIPFGFSELPLSNFALKQIQNRSLDSISKEYDKELEIKMEQESLYNFVAWNAFILNLFAQTSRPHAPNSPYETADEKNRREYRELMY